MGRICLSLLLALWAGAAQADCLAFGRDIARANSQTTFEDRMADHLAANLSRFGEVDFDCLSHAFEALPANTDVTAGRTPDGVEHRFTLDRKGAFLARDGGIYTLAVEARPGGLVVLKKANDLNFGLAR